MPADWQPLGELPDLRRVGTIAFDTETKDGGLAADHGPGWPWNDGYICGLSIAYRADGEIRAHYFPLRHPDSQNFDRKQLLQWLRDLIASDVRIVTENGGYDWGWLRADADIRMPPSERLEELGALATMVDENRRKYGLDALCDWRGVPGKDEALLHEGCATLDLIPKGRKKKSFKPKPHIYRLPARYVGPYAEQDAISTLAVFESLNPILDREGTRNAYRLECDLLPLVLEMRRRGIRIDTAEAERVRDLLLGKRDAVFAELSAKLGANVGMEEIGRTKWLAPTFDAYGIAYPRTEKNNPSFTAGTTGWMHKHPHWLPQLIVKADKYNNAAVNVLETYILGHVVRGRVHAEIHPHRSDEGGTRSLRISYSDPPLQLMPSRDEELAPLIRGVFLPDEGEVWAKPDVSQQEFRLLTHYAARHKLMKAAEAVERYRKDPNTDFHNLVMGWTGLDRSSAKATNFAKIYGAGRRKFAEMIGKPESEAAEIYDRYDREFPFVAQLAERCEHAVKQRGFITLYDGARRHWTDWAAGGRWIKGAGPCAREEAVRRTQDPGHPWYGQRLWLADTRKALNALIQGSAARHTKLWMRACWREGIVPLLQMHDCLDCSVSSREQAELVARLGCDAVQLEVPMQVDLKYGRSWGDAKHTWEELHASDETPRKTNGAGISEAEKTELPPAYQIDWAAKLEQEFPRVSAAAIATETPPTPPPWEDDEDYIRARMMEEGIVSTPPPAPAEQPPSDGNGHGDFSGFKPDDYPHGEQERERCTATFTYQSAAREPYLLIRKFEWTDKAGKRKKAYPQYHRENGRWMKDKPAGPVIPYRLPELLAAPIDAVVDIFEGEKDADRGATCGLTATTNPEGATMPDGKTGKWQPELNEYFRGRRVRLHQDNDLAGEVHVAKIISELRDIAKDITVVCYPEQKPGGDFSDFMDNGGTIQAMVARAQPADANALDAVCAADEEIEDYDWIWPGRFALKKIGLITGLPDEGKGVLLSDIIARVTCGSAWPCGEGESPKGNVILLTAEDDINDTIIPRLMAAGADLKRVHIIKMIRTAGKERMFSLVTDLPLLRQKALAIGDIKMIVIDPIAAYLGIGKIDSFRATDVRAMIGPLKEFAEELRLFILGIMHFNKKIDVTNLLLRVSDSLAYTAAARHVYGIVNDEDNKRKLFVKGKNNLAPREQKTLAFGFDVREVGIDKRTGNLIRRPHILWHPEPVDITATEALQAAAENKSPSTRDNAKHFIKALLSNEPVGAKDVREAAKENGISNRTLDRAREALGARVAVKRDGPLNDKGEATWRWHWMSKQEDENDDQL
jgi:DNA polymerase I-like protein with 3'-5' exonuclease and polymerase domains